MSDAISSSWDRAAPRGGREGTPPSAAPEGQPERGHLLAIANQQDVTDQHRAVPSLALDRREPRKLRELLRGRSDQRQLTLLRQVQTTNLACGAPKSTGTGLGCAMKFSLQRAVGSPNAYSAEAVRR